MRTVDMQTGETTDDRMTPVTILPPPESACQVCGRNPAHNPTMPHDANSIYYQYAFYGEHGRWPTWTDAMAHCNNEIKAMWEKALRERGVPLC